MIENYHSRLVEYTKSYFIFQRSGRFLHTPVLVSQQTNENEILSISDAPQGLPFPAT